MTLDDLIEHLSEATTARTMERDPSTPGRFIPIPVRDGYVLTRDLTVLTDRLALEGAGLTAEQRGRAQSVLNAAADRLLDIAEELTLAYTVDGRAFAPREVPQGAMVWGHKNISDPILRKLANPESPAHEFINPQIQSRLILHLVSNGR